MRLYAPQVPKIAQEVVRILALAGKDGGIEPGDPREVERDVAAVLQSYLDAEREIGDRAKELLASSNRGHGELQRIMAQIAESKGIKLGEEALDYVLDQIVEMLMHSNNVEEVWGADVELRRRMAPVFKKYMAAGSGLDAEVRAQLRHVQEGTRDYEVEYGRVLEQVKRRKGLA